MRLFDILNYSNIVSHSVVIALAEHSVWFNPKSDHHPTDNTASSEGDDDQLSNSSYNAYRDVAFYHYSTLLPNAQHRIYADNRNTLAEAGFDAAHETRFIIHGWYDDVNSKISTELRAAYALHRQPPLNLIVVDWGLGARTINYFLAKKRVFATGLAVAAFIDALCTHTGLTPGQIGLIGHSLGAHVAGIGGKHVRTGRLASIVGLDAALPLFWYNEPEGRLHHGDAAYVEGIHTNVGFKGMARPIGHADFYPNWGRRQPGCGWDMTRSCSHKRVISLFAESVRASAATGQGDTNGEIGPMEGIRCAGGWQEIMERECQPNGTQSATMGGEPLNASGAAQKRGSFYVRTNGGSPFVVV